MSLQIDAARRLARQITAVESTVSALARDVVAAHERCDELRTGLDLEIEARRAQNNTLRKWAEKRFERWAAA